MPSAKVLVVDDSPTILKVVDLVLTKAGHKVRTASDGQECLQQARADSPDLILLDFVMPKMNGYEVCRQLADDDGLKHIPVVLMSAKADQVGDRFVKVMGIVDYITKPFSPEAITAVVDHTLEKFSGPIGTAETVRMSTDDVVRLARASSDTEPEDPTAHTLRSVREELAQTVASRIAGLFSLAESARRDTKNVSEDDVTQPHSFVPTDAGAVADAARAALTDDLLRSILQRGMSAVDGTGAPALSGDIQTIPIAEVLQLLSTQRQDGILRLARGAATVEVYFRQGAMQICLATGLPDEFLLGRFIVELDFMSRGDFQGFLDSRTTRSKLIGSQLVKLGYITASDLHAALRRQTCELIYETLRWTFGGFRFQPTRDLPAPAVEAALALDVEAVLMEGFRRVDEWHLIERELTTFDEIFLRNEDALSQMGDGRLTREELSVLELVNGKNTVKDIVRESRMGSFDVSKVLYRLLSIKLIRRRVQPVAV